MMIMNTLVKLYFEINVFIINSQLLKLKMWISQLTKLPITWRIHVNFHSKMFIMIKHALNNEIIKLMWNLFL
jgi:hypothetical protein